jgi:hypothetical protein
MTSIDDDASGKCNDQKQQYSTVVLIEKTCDLQGTKCAVTSNNFFVHVADRTEAEAPRYHTYCRVR